MSASSSASVTGSALAPIGADEKVALANDDVVATDAVLVYAELPTALYARTRNQYVVRRLRPVLVKVVTLAPTVAICVQVVPFVERSILNPVSLPLLSAQFRRICER